MPRRTMPPEGPRGGRTTTTPGGFVKSTIYFLDEELRALHRRAAVERTTVSDLVRQAIRQYLNLDADE